MSEHTHEEISKHAKVYWMVFAALIVGTIVTVAVSNVHLGILLGIGVAVLVAIVKGSLVAGYFMHLLNERKLIYAVLVLTAVFAVAMVTLVMCSFADQQGKNSHLFQVPQRHVVPHHDTAEPEGAHVP